MKIKYLVSIIILVVILTGFMGCDLLKKKVEKQETTTYTLNSAGKTKLKIKNTSGDVKVSKSMDTMNTIRIIAVKISRVRQKDLDKPIENIKINIDTSSEVVTIETDIRQERNFLKKSYSGQVDY